MYKYRPGGVGFAQSMQQIVTVSKREDVAREVSSQLGTQYTAEELTFEYFGRDQRNDWSTWVVYLAGYGPVGFTNRCLDPGYRKETSRWGGLEDARIPAD